jgi:hypothetical protein
VSLLGVPLAVWAAPLRPGYRKRLGREKSRRAHPKPLGAHRAHGSAKVGWVASGPMGPIGGGLAQSLTTKPWPLRPLGQVGMARVDRAARVAKGQRGGGNRHPRTRVCFSRDHPRLVCCKYFKDATKAAAQRGRKQEDRTLVQIPQRRGIRLAFVRLIRVGPAKTALLGPRSIPAFEAGPTLMH